MKNLSLSQKLVGSFLVMGLVPMLVLAVITWRSADRISDNVGRTYQTTAENILDKVERNLFERYGDVQAFGVNTAVREKSSWYQVGSATNRIADVANQYANLYGFYLISLFVDLDGKVIAVNDHAPDGKPIDTAPLYQKNYKEAGWFQDALAGRFLKSDILDGTVVEDVHVDEDVKKVYGGEGLVVGFAAPVKDSSGKVIGVWNNRAAFSLVEEIFQTAYKDLSREGMAGAELTLLDSRGRVIVDFDPGVAATNAVVKHDMNVLLKLNLAEAGVEAARAVVEGRSGHGSGFHVRKRVEQTTGYAASHGALGYPGLKWGVLVRVATKTSMAAAAAIKTRVVQVLGLSALLLLAASLWLSRMISGPLLASLQEMREVGSGLAAASSQVSSASQAQADGAGQRAAALEETSASLEEMSSMTKLNAESAGRAKDLAATTRSAAEAGAADMGRMADAMEEIRNSSSSIANILKSIDEIAFQTNILALNAAVEAARAGEAGMGFSVVAEEVRNLAQRSAAAARETAQGIQDSISKSERGVEISERVKLSLQEIVLSIRAMDEVAGEVASHSTEQNQGISQVNSAVADMDKLTQSDAASAEECAAAARQLQNQAARLNRAVEEVGRLVQGRGGEPATAPAPSLAPVPQPAARGTAPGVREPRASAKVPATPQSF